MNAFRHLLQQTSPRAPIGSWLMSASPIVCEAMGCAGFEWGVVDMEHTPLDQMEIIHILQALAGTPLVPVVRVPWNERVMIKRVLDAGASTLLVPFVQDADEARAAVAATRYPPEGCRGVAAMSRASRFGTTPNFVATANARIGVIVQLETPEAIDRVAAIGAVDGVDALFVGPGDLSASLGHAGQPMHPDVLALTAQAVAGAKALGKPIGTVGGTPEVVRHYLAMGFDFVAVASDLSLMMRAGQAALAALGIAPAASAPAAAPTQSVY